MQTTGSLRSSYQYHHHDYGRLHGECHIQPFEQGLGETATTINGNELLMQQDHQQQFLPPPLSVSSGTDHHHHHQFTELHHIAAGNCYDTTSHELNPETTAATQQQQALLVYSLDRADVCQATSNTSTTSHYLQNQPETTTACSGELQTYMTFHGVAEYHHQPSTAAHHQQSIGTEQQEPTIYYEPTFDATNHLSDRQPIIYSEQQQPVAEESATGRIESHLHQQTYFQQQQQQYLDSQQTFVSSQQIIESYGELNHQCISSDLVNGHHQHLAELEKPTSYDYSDCYASQFAANNHASDGNNNNAISQDDDLQTRATHSPAVSSISDSSSEESSNSTPTRDEKRAREANLPMSYHEIVNLSIEHFNEQLARHTLTEVQLQLIKDIRRRGKNKVAAQSCRKRKMEQIYELQHEVSGLANKRLNLEQECDQLAREYESLIQHFNRINSIVQRELQQQQQSVALDQTHLLPGTTC